MKRTRSCGGWLRSGWQRLEPRWFAVCCLCLLWLAGPGAIDRLRAQDSASEASQVVVLYNTRDKSSREVAEFYADARGIPADRLIGLACAHPTVISRDEYERQIVGPLRDQLEGRGLARFSSEIVPAADNQPGAVRYRMTASKVRYLVTVYGMPYRIGNDTNRADHFGSDTPPHVRKNGAAVDNELILLPSDGQYPIAGAANNPFLNHTNPAALNPANGVFLVSRLDGPTPELAKGLVSKALQAERQGLWGRAYFDIRGIKDGAYRQGDEWIEGAAGIARFLGFDTYVDRASGTLPVGFPLSEVALYAGWYDQDVSGPFTLPSVEFAPGAIAYHIHSYSAGNPRSDEKHWVGPLVARGATVTMGCVDEPFLQATPNIAVLLGKLARGHNLGEAYLAATPTLSWQNILIGDPLYRPFVPNLLERAREMFRTNSPLLPWAVVQTVNFQVVGGTNVDVAIRALEQMPGSTNSPVMAEKVARLYETKTRLKPAIQYAQFALAAGGTPQQRVRLLLDMAEWQRVLGQTQDSFKTLEQFAVEFPGHPRLLAVRKDQLDLARDLALSAEVTRLKQEVERLTPPPANGRTP